MKQFIRILKLKKNNAMIRFYFKISDALVNLKDLPLLFLRLVLAYGFYAPAMAKMNDIGAISEWFKSMEMVAPTLNAYLVTYTEFFGFILLTLGLGTRIITVPLIIAMIVAIKSVHWENGFEASENGFEIPVYYIAMLFVLFIFGSGKFGADYWIGKKLRK